MILEHTEITFYAQRKIWLKKKTATRILGAVDSGDAVSVDDVLALDPQGLRRVWGKLPTRTRKALLQMTSDAVPVGRMSR